MSTLLSGLPPIAYAGRVSCVTGYGAAARHQIWVLRKHGLKIKIIDAGSVADPDPQKESVLVQSCVKSDPEAVQGTAATIIHVAPNCAPPIRAQTLGPHILVSVWETTKLPREWVPIINDFDQVWCATHWQSEVYRHSGVQPDLIRTVPFALDPDLYSLVGDTLPEVQRFRDEGYTVLGAMFQSTARKAPEALIGAYLKAFQANERVVLVLKVYEGDDPNTPMHDKIDQIVRKYRTYGFVPRIEVMSRRLTDAETHAFHRSIDCYVSTHRAEGWSLPIHEALLLGRPVIATDWSAPSEYARGLFMPVTGQLQPAHSLDWQPIYFIDQDWMDPDILSAAKWMRGVYAGRAVYDRQKVLQRFNALVEQAGTSAANALGELLR